MPPDSASYAAQSDPDRNHHFSRRWLEPADLDREADVMLQRGQHTQAEHLAHRAAQIRLTGGDRWPVAVPR